MNQITQMLMESNRRMKRLMQAMEGVKKPDMDVIAAAQREFEGQIKGINAVISAFGIASKNKRALVGLDKMNIMDDSTAIDLMLGDPEVDKVKCQFHNDLITRHDCLSYSGEAKHIDDCKGCEVGQATKNLLLGELQ